ncbi:MAG: DUF4982 domain-containing protein, partial [Ferruginibacter sp.]
FDAWELKKTPLDFHLIFPDWHEQDLRAMIRRDRNHPSVIMWSYGNEVGEQYTDEKGAAIARKLKTIVKEEDTTRPATVAMNYAKPNMPLPEQTDVISLNYQGEGIRNGGAYAGLKGISTPPLFPAFHSKFTGKVILSTENASALSSRGEYLFPVVEGNSAPIRDGLGGNPKTQQVSAYELYSVDFGSSADKVFATMDQHPYVAGGFVWTGWDYLGEPTPYYLSRSSYSGIIDLAGFKKDRFYLYQSHWRPGFPMAHILPHWTWPNRVGQITPVHVFTSGDEAELFLNGKSLGRKKKAPLEYRLRWDDVKFTPGELSVVAYRNGRKWAEDIIETTGDASKLTISADRTVIRSDGKDLSFITVRVTDKNGLVVPYAKNALTFSIEGPGEIAATDNGDAANLVAFPSLIREAFNGLCLVIVRAKAGKQGIIRLKAASRGLKAADILFKTMNGIEPCRKIKSDKRTGHIPIILLTALTDDADQLKGLKTGANDYLTKPFNFEILNIRIRNLFDLNESLKNTYTRQLKIVTPEIELQSEDDKLMLAISQYIEDNLYSPKLSVEDLSRHVCMSRGSLYSKIVNLTGETPVEFIRSVKLNKAAVLLENSDMKIAQIGYTVGFTSPNYFARAFKAKFNLLPSEYLLLKRHPS